MTRRRRAPRSTVRSFAISLFWLGLILAAFYLFMILGIPQMLGEFIAQFYTPGS